TAQVIVPSANIPVKYAQTPSFSPDGKHIAFNNSDIGTGHLGIMDYDDSQSPPAFSNLRELTQHPSKILAWPSFLPDSQAVVYHEGGEFRSFAAAELRLVEVATGEVKTIGALNGYAEDGSFALPYGLSVDGQKNFMPTVLPRPIGGYYWVMFTSRRTYGNVLGPTTTTTRRKIWVAAIDIDHTTKADPSHPAFYLTGQEEQSGSLRPFASLDPCRQEGASCESGADCCAGFCRETGRDTSGTPILNCVPPPVSTCSNLDEACVTPADCCDTTLLCILGRCSLPTPIIQ
ncbi:MAG TPA: hypothetical protein VGJ84_07325, partial [Polyangiaceae bacterium]